LQLQTDDLFITEHIVKQIYQPDNAFYTLETNVAAEKTVHILRYKTKNVFHAAAGLRFCAVALFLFVG
jgi:hypothetical protein